MARIIDPNTAGELKAAIPGIKPPVRDFAPSDDGDPREVDAFNRMIRNLRKENPTGFTPTQ
jgi:hypothetical protein